MFQVRGGHHRHWASCDDGGDEGSRNLVAADLHLRSGRGDHFDHRIWNITVIIAVGEDDSQ